MSADLPLAVRRATARDRDDVLDILAVGSAWALRKGVAQWPERDDAGFVYRLAIRRSARGLGARLIEWADGEASANRRGYLCLDCLSSNVRLRRYYEDLGFRYSGEVSGPLEHPHTAAHGSWRAALYERKVGDRLPRGVE